MHEEIDTVARRCYLKIRCSKCGTLHFLELFKPAFRSKWYIKSSWIEAPVFVDLPPRKLRKNQNRRRNKKHVGDRISR